MVFRRLRKRGRDRARSSERRRLGKAFQKDGPTTAKLLRWAVASLTLGMTRSPCSAERRDLRPDIHACTRIEYLYMHRCWMHATCLCFGGLLFFSIKENLID